MLKGRAEAEKRNSKRTVEKGQKKREHDHNTRSKKWKDGEHFEVEAIQDHKLHKGNLSFYVKWKGWSEKYCSWVPEKDVNATCLVAAYGVKMLKQKTK